MPLEIHAVMQDANYKQMILHRLIKDNMRLLADAAQSRGDFLGAVAKHWIVQQGPETGLKLVAIQPGLIDTEFANGVIGYFGQIGFGAPA